MSQSTTTILSHTSKQLITVEPHGVRGYTGGAVLAVWTLEGSRTIALDHPALQGLLAVLPTPLLLEALAGRGLTDDQSYPGGLVIDTGVSVRICLNDAAGTYVKLTPQEFAAGKQRAAEEQGPHGPQDAPAPMGDYHLHWCFNCTQPTSCTATACVVTMRHGRVRCSTPILCRGCGGTGVPGAVTLQQPALDVDPRTGERLPRQDPLLRATGGTDGNPFLALDDSP